jgi:hypothetical protein
MSMIDRNSRMETINPNLKIEALRFGYGETKLGLVLVALSTCGVAAIFLGDLGVEGSKRGRSLRPRGNIFAAAVRLVQVVTN